MTKSTREDILDTLKTSGPLSVYDLSLKLNLTVADIRYHITNLFKEKRIEKEPPAVGLAGRPAARYKIPLTDYPDNLAFFISALLEIRPLDVQDMKRLANYFVNSSRSDQETSMIGRLNDLINKTRRFHYNPRWEVHSKGPTVIFDNCPYREIIGKSNQICEFDRIMIEEWLNLPVQMEYKFNPKRQSCSFLVKSQKITK